MHRILFFAAASAAVSCVSIDGGAVEASWVVVSQQGYAIAHCGCSDPQIDSVRLKLVGNAPPVMDAEPCHGRASCQFSCDRRTGATPFDIPPGLYLMSLVPVDAAGQDLVAVGDGGGTRVVTPAPVLREVVRGQPTQLDALAIVAGCSPSCTKNKSPVCDSQ
jgi:hypothetical protein